MSRIGRKRLRAIALSRETIAVLDAFPLLTQDEARNIAMDRHQSLADYMYRWERRLWAAVMVPDSALGQKFTGLGDIVEGTTP